MNREFSIPDARAMEAFGACLAATSAGLQLITLQGELGAGKTTLVRGMLRGLGHAGTVKSPTYTLVEPYDVAGRSLYHFDLYRLAVAQELDDIGLRDYLDAEALCVVEWPERGGKQLPPPDLQIVFDSRTATRLLTIAAQSARGVHALQTLRWPG
ncbi:MAG: tRNA (adenosine(37)-N6)-threonylcarbamoyltransferase complex ATPase subunit type 1 TsaE [Gammaproteobacteria bacterium]